MAMEKEFSLLKANDVWDIVDLPKDHKAIGSKWIFKRKRDAEGNVERYKARLVAQGFTQKDGIDYDKTFSLVVRFESIRTIIALAARQNLQLHQIDITTAFLNGTLEEVIYMKQSEGFEIKGSENLKKMGFISSMNDRCIYTLISGGEIFIRYLR